MWLLILLSLHYYYRLEIIRNFFESVEIHSFISWLSSIAVEVVLFLQHGVWLIHIKVGIITRLFYIVYIPCEFCFCHLVSPSIKYSSNSYLYIIWLGNCLDYSTSSLSISDKLIIYLFIVRTLPWWPTNIFFWRSVSLSKSFWL